MNANEIQLKVVTQGYKDRLNKDAVDLVDHLVEKVNQQKDYDAKVRELGTFLNQRIVDEQT